MIIELNNSDVSKVEYLFEMLALCDIEILILNKYGEDERKGYVSSQILDRDDILDFASGKRRVGKDEVIERHFVCDYVDGVGTLLLNAITDARG